MLVGELLHVGMAYIRITETFASGDAFCGVVEAGVYDGSGCGEEVYIEMPDLEVSV